MSAQKRILVIDDDEDFCEMMEDLLTSAGYTVEVSANPVVTVESAMMDRYDLIVLDLRMPQLSGIEMAEAFYKHGLKTPVLVISAYLKPAIEAQLRSYGITHILPKPFPSANLLKTIEAAMAGRE